MVMKHLCDKGLTFTAGGSISNRNNFYFLNVFWQSDRFR